MDIELTANDGFPLTAHLFPAKRPRGAVIIVGAMGVPQRFYEPMAEWLAEQQFTAMTFDYRGIGASRRGSLSKLDATIVTWAERDVAAALDGLRDYEPRAPITWLGHSLGGQIIPFVPNRERADKIITVATGSGYWRENAAPLRRKVWIFWWGAVPLATPVFGYFPGRMLGMVGDLPKGVVTQWRKWCLDRNYAVGAEGPDVEARFAEVTTPITSFSFTDDEMMSERNVASIHGFYARAPKTMHRFAPADLEVRRVGHFGFFRREMADVWRKHLVTELAHGQAA
jgi:predicted alpha/beta hydrolase